MTRGNNWDRIRIIESMQEQERAERHIREKLGGYTRIDGIYTPRSPAEPRQLYLSDDC